MSVDSKMTAIADGFRSSRGITGRLTLDDMAELAAANVGTTELLLPADIPDYVRVEAIDVAQRVRKVLTDDSIVFLAMSDTHYPGDEDSAWNQAQNNEGGLHAAMAAKALGYMLPLDFVAHLGDVGNGESTTTPDEMRAQIQKFITYFQEADNSLPVFIAIGNHDAGIYYHEAQADGSVYTLDGNWLYENFTAHSESENTVVGGQEYGGYCYRDFEDKKLRVFLLNTSEAIIYAQQDEAVYERSDQATLGAQRLWLANAILDLNSKSDAAEWGFIILCHYPADYGATSPLGNLLKAYVAGESFTITDPSGSYDIGDGTNATVNFSGANASKFIAQFHGHVHNFKVAKLNSLATGSAVEYDAWRICTPNVQYSRENYYTGTYSGISYYEETSYPKTPGTADEISFVINIINPSEMMIYSICYGAGYDRVISYTGTTYYSITANLTDVALDNSSFSVEAGLPYSATLTSTVDEYEITSVSIVMGGTDITDSAYVDGLINISEVTGNIVITAKATKLPTSNLHLIAEAADSTDPYNGTGYMNGAYLTADADGNVKEGVDASTVVTGFIPYKAPATGLPQTIVVSGAEWQSISHCRLYFINANKQSICSPWITGVSTGSEGLAFNYNIETLGDKHFKFIPILNSSGTDWTAGGGAGAGTSAYIRLSLVGTGEDLIITFEDAETAESYTVTSKLTNVSNSNGATTVDNGASYEATLTATEGDFTSVSVTMGGVDITSSAYSNGKINIASVTGNIIITAAAAVTYSVTKQLTNVTCSNNITSVVKGSAFSATLAASTGYSLDTVTISMGGEDITSTVYSAGKISITSVTGNIEIIASAVVTETPVVNLLTTAVDTDGSIYNGVGYKEGVNISSSGSGERTLAGSYASGFIPIDLTTETLRLCNIGREVVSYKQSLVIGFTALDSTKVCGDVDITDTSAGQATVNEDGSLTITGDMFELTDVSSVKYVRITCSYIGSDSAVYIE